VSYEFFIARRYFRSKRHARSISLIAYISIAGVAVGVGALIIVLSLFNGFSTEIRDRLIGVDAHARVVTVSYQPIQDYQTLIKKLETFSHVTGVAPFIYGEAMIVAPGGQGSSLRSAGVRIKGVDPDRLGKVSDLPRHVTGRLILDKRDGMEFPGIVLGASLADRLQTTIGGHVQVVSPEGISLGLGGVPKVWTFTVMGLFETGMYDFDWSLALLSLPSAQRLHGLDQGEVSGIEVKLDDLTRADAFCQEVTREVGYPFVARSWTEMYRNLYNWMALEKWLAFIVLALIILVAAFNIISLLTMIVMEKGKEIGVLKAMGATGRSIRRIFLYHGVGVGLIGIIVGCLFGTGLCWLQEHYRLISLPGDVYWIDALPIDLRGTDLAAIAVAALAICVGASLYPARKAAALHPVEAIRYE
jgi:lipoprotein-releasing system permease protein